MRTSFRFLLFCFVISSAVWADEIKELKIQDLKDKVLTVNIELLSDPEQSRFQPLEIYDVYQTRHLVEGKLLYEDFVDSVYLKRVEESQLIFSYIWDGEKKYLKQGFYLFPTGRRFQVDKTEIHQMFEKEQPNPAALPFRLYIMNGINCSGYILDVSPANNNTNTSMTFGSEIDVLLRLGASWGLRARAFADLFWGDANYQFLLEYYQSLNESIDLYANTGLFLNLASFQGIISGSHSVNRLLSGGFGLIVPLGFIHPITPSGQWIADISARFEMVQFTFYDTTPPDNLTTMVPVFSLKMGYRF